MDRFFTLFRYFAPPNYHEKAGVSSSFSERRHKFTSAKEIVGKSHIFQSKHSVRCTLGVSSILSQPHFNPHSHMGSDLLSVYILKPFIVSIHTPTWGVTSTCCFHCCTIRRFNPHSHMGSDLHSVSKPYL